jgi:hypothetical protein
MRRSSRAVARPGARLHQAPHRVLRQGIELVQHLRVTLNGREIADAPSSVHLLDQGITDPRGELGAPLVLPLLERWRARNLEPFKERPPDLSRTVGQAGGVHVHHARGERDGGLLHEQMLTADLGLQHRQGLGERVAGVPGRRIGPQQIGEIVSAEPAPALHAEPDEEREMLPGPEPDRLAGDGEQQRRPKRGQMQMRCQSVVSQWFGTALLGTQVNALSTPCGTGC